MTKSRLTIALALACLAAVVVTAAPAGARSGSSGLGVMIPAHRGRPIPRANASQDSLNWSGYAVTNPVGHKITKVTSTFVVPAVKGTTPGFSSAWTGIGGYNSSDLIQAGTASEYVPGLGANYYAWYEILPASETQISNCSGDATCAVHPGDNVTVTINTTGAIQANQTWNVSIVDAGHWTYSKALTYASTYSSAEWILEAPTIGVQVIMPALQTTTFDPNNTFSVDNGAAQNIASGGPVDISMNTIEGVPSALDADGDGFNACAYALSCAAPAS
jgi:hypothetical protein